MCVYICSTCTYRLCICMYVRIYTDTDFTLLRFGAVSRVVRADALRCRPSPVPPLAREDLKRCGTYIYVCVCVCK